MAVIQETIGWGWAYVQHVVFMFDWAWIPGILWSALLSARFRLYLEETALKRQGTAAGVWAALAWGMLSGVGRRTSLATAERLWNQRAPGPVVLAYLVGSHSLMLPLLLLFTLLIGLEFGLGLFLGGLVMVGLLRFAPQPRVPEPPSKWRSGEQARGGLPSWRILLASRDGWFAILREAARPFRHLGGSLVGGLILGALVLAVDNHGYWFFPKWMGDDGLGPALAASFLAPLLSVILFLSPGGNLLVASSIWKTWTLAYPGVLSFVLVGLLNPLTIRTLLRQHGRTHGGALAATIYLTAALSGVVVAGLFALLGISVTHVPWFKELVDRIIMTLPFTMLGAPGSAMEGM